VQKLPVTLPELVDSSPSITDDGSIVLGLRANNVFVLDLLTGACLCVCVLVCIVCVCVCVCVWEGGGGC